MFLSFFYFNLCATKKLFSTFTFNYAYNFTVNYIKNELKVNKSYFLKVFKNIIFTEVICDILIKIKVIFFYLRNDVFDKYV